MKRKLIKQAGQAYTLTLPIEWIRKHKLDSKSEVNLDILEKSIIVSTSSPLEEEKVSLNIKDWEGRTIRNHIIALYAKGVDEIIITSDKDISSEIRRAINNVMGYALVSQEK